jgi:hypothetical protein
MVAVIIMLLAELVEVVAVAVAEAVLLMVAVRAAQVALAVY